MMPPETFTWDRKVLSRDRKQESSLKPHHYSLPHQHQISPGGGGYSGVGGVNGGANSWREQQHLPSNPHPSPRCISDGRGRADPPGYGKQGSRPFNPEEEEEHGLVLSRSNVKSFVAESFRSKLVVEVSSCNSLNPHPEVADLHNQEKKNLLSPVDWKSMKWSRSSSLPCKGSSLSQSNSSKSMGSLCNDTKNEAHQTNVSPIQSSTSCDASATCAFIESLSSPCDETSSRKRQRRLGWGEGLAKYEKKKVVGVDDCETRNELVCGNKAKQLFMESANYVDECPAVFADCATPVVSSDCATTVVSAVGFSCSPGIVEKQSIKCNGFDHEATNFSVSPIITMSQNHVEWSNFKLENLDVDSIARLNSAIKKLLQSDVKSFGDSGYVRLTAMNKLSIWKGEVLKALEITESEIDKLDVQLKTMTQRSGSSSSLFLSYPSKTSGNHVHKTNNPVEFEDIESPGSATSKLVEVPFSRENKSLSRYDNRVENSSKSEINASTIVLDTTLIVDDHVGCEDKLHGSIWASNRAASDRAANELSSLLLLPEKQANIDTGISCVESNEIIKAKLLRRKRFQQFKERVSAIKYKVLQHYWKQDVRSLSSKKFSLKSQKKLDHSSRVRTGFSSPGGKLSLTRPNSKMVKFVGKMILNSELKPLRVALKMPSLIISDNKEKEMMRFVSSNGMVEDPLGVEKERSIINYWTEEEIKIFMDKLAQYGKDFTKIASFLTHKTTGDCIEFYYKNHKSDTFKKEGKKLPDLAKQCVTDSYLVTSVKRSIRGSLDASGIAANAAEESRNILGTSSKISRGSSLDVDEIERETVAADVLAGICSSLSCEAMGSSCLTGTVDDETCSDDSWKEMDLNDWTDEERSAFILALLSNGNDFDMISERVVTRSRDQCKIFFSKARTCLALDAIICSEDNHDVGSYADVEAESGTCNEKTVLNIEVDLPSTNSKLNTEPETVSLFGAEPDSGTLDEKGVSNMEVNLPSLDFKSNTEQDDVVLSTEKVNDESGHMIIDSQVENLDQGVEPIISSMITGEASNVPDKPLTSYSMVQEESMRISSGGNKNDGYLTKEETHPCPDGNTQAADIPSSRGSFRKVVVESDSLEKASVIAQPQNNHLSGCSSLDNNVESQIINGYATPDRNFRNVNGDLNYLQRIRLSGENSRHDHQRFAIDGLLQNFNGIKQARNPRSQLDGSVGVEKPRSSGKVKLFGQILTKPCNQNSSPIIVQQNENHQRVAQSFSFRASEDQSLVGGYSAWAKLNGSSNSRVTTDNSQLTGYGFWDGNRIQTGFSSLPNTAVLMAKYPDGRTQNLNGLDLIHTSTTVSPLTSNSLQHRQEMMVSGLNRRRNGFQTVTAVQQTARGIVGINNGIVVVGGVGGGRQCSGVSDPVAAIRMHYNPEQFNGQAVMNNIIAQDEPWRGQGNVGL